MIASPAAPKNRIANAEFRKKLRERAKEDREFQELIWIRCSRDIVFFCDAVAITYSPKDYPEAPERPFILYPYQEEAMISLNNSIGKEDRLVEKSRDMGASWMCVTLFVWRWLFRRHQSFLFGSRKEEFVDAPGDPKTLFYKARFIIKNMPTWMQPNMDDTHMHLGNRDNGSTIDGESTNKSFATGDRRTAVLLDEFPKVEQGFPILSATRDVTKSRIFNGTPQGASGAYYETRQKMLATRPEQVLRLHWSLHPEKSLGLYSTVNNEVAGELKRIDQTYRFPKDYPFILDGKLRSPWYDNECLRAPNDQEIAQELDIDYAGSGWQFFDAKVIAKCIKEYAMPPLHVGEMSYGDFGKKPNWSEAPGARLQLWFNPDDKDRVPFGKRYIIGCDVAMGAGGQYSSNSVASVVDRDTGEKVAQFHTSDINPNDFADYAMAMCHWFNDALLIWEINGPGSLFAGQVKKSGYRNIFWREDEEKFIKKKSKNPGWFSNKATKKLLLADYGVALKRGKFINRCELALRECYDYVQQPDHSIEHAKSVGGSDPNSTGENHGDMCFVAGTMIETIDGERAIQDIRAGDLVLTRDGYKPVLVSRLSAKSSPVFLVELSNGSKLVGTGNHPVFTKERGWVELSLLIQSDTLITCQGRTKRSQKQKRLSSTGFVSTAARSLSTCTYSDTIGLTRDTSTLGLGRCMLRSGKLLTAPFLLAATFITRMKIRSTTPSRIWSASLLANTSRRTAIQGNASKGTGIIACTSIPASNAARSTRRSARIEQSFAAKPATRHSREQTTCTTKHGNAPSVVQNSLRIRTDHRRPALGNAGRVYALKISPLPENKPVYNLSVDDCPEYFAQGVLVHNCIADALCNRGMADVSRTEEVSELNPPEQSFAYRRQIAQTRRLSTTYW